MQKKSNWQKLMAQRDGLATMAVVIAIMLTLAGISVSGIDKKMLKHAKKESEKIEAVRDSVINVRDTINAQKTNQR